MGCPLNWPYQGLLQQGAWEVLLEAGATLLHAGALQQHPQQQTGRPQEPMAGVDPLWRGPTAAVAVTPWQGRVTLQLLAEQRAAGAAAARGTAGAAAGLAAIPAPTLQLLPPLLLQAQARGCRCRLWLTLHLLSRRPALGRQQG